MQGCRMKQCTIAQDDTREDPVHLCEATTARSDEMQMHSTARLQFSRQIHTVLILLHIKVK